jgi:signal transduction histidine kinase
MLNNRLAQVRDIGFFFLAYATYLLIMWSFGQVAQRPYDGFDWETRTGEVFKVNPSSPAYGVIYPGDVIVGVNGISLERAIPLYHGLQPGRTVEFDVLQDGLAKRVTINLIQAPREVFFRRMTPFIVSLAFWIVGVGVFGFARAKVQAVALLMWCLLVSGILSSGGLAPAGPIWVADIFNVLLWMVGPVTVHFHLLFLQAKVSKPGKLAMSMLYGLSVVGSLPYIIWGTTALNASKWGDASYTAGLLELSFCMLSSILVLLRAYWRSSDEQVRKKIRLPTVSAFVGLTPIVLLNLLPDVLLNMQLFPYEIGILFLVAIPLGYGYAIIRYQLMKLDRVFNRAVTIALTIVLMVVFYRLLVGLLRMLLPTYWQESLLAETAIVLLMGAVFYLARTRIQRLVDWVFYGGWYDFHSAIERIDGVINVADDPQDLARRLSQRISEVLSMDRTFLLLAGPSGQVCGCDKKVCLHPVLFDRKKSYPFLPDAGALFQYLKSKAEPITTTDLHLAMADSRLSKGEKWLLGDKREKIWLPIQGEDRLLGILVAGPKQGSDPFSGLDVAVLRAVARQVSVRLQNMILLDELERRAKEVERLHGKILRTREEERKKWSRELHDNVIQALVGLNYELVQRGGGEFSRLSADVRSIIQTIRQMCQQLRPPTLDNLGLVAAIHSRLREFKAEGEDPPVINLHIEGDEEMPVPDEIAICLYRTLNEALVNIQKHACAKHVFVELNLASYEVSLTVEDDGVGFLIPQSLGQLLNDDHFGLVGIRERLELVHGTLGISTAPGKGMRIHARVPLENEEQLEELSKEKVLV